MKRIFLALVAFPIAAQAGMYKCEEGGRVTYSDQPCGQSARSVDVRPATGQYNQAEARRMERQTANDLRFLGQVEQSRQQAETRKALRAAVPPKEDDCARMKREHADAKYWADRFVHPDNVAREKERAKKLEHDSFFECDRSRRIGAD